MDRPTCKTCPYWKQLSEAGLYGECRHGPAKHGHDTEVKCDPGTVNITAGDWFDQHEDEWCGEHPDFPAYLASLKTSALSPVDHLSVTLKRLDPDDLDKALKTLRMARDREIMKLYLGLGCESYEAADIARIMKLTRARTRQVINSCVNVLLASFPQSS